ncbi:MAG: TetR family transcriptional regulator [Paracoccaceae bacterium]|nr:TetR family transcriptional regulator [Paracoccaceae bacterium]
MADTAPPETDRSAATRALLVTAAMKHFGEKGFDAASLRDIVADAGQNLSAVKYHFGSKEKLFYACLRAAAQRIGSMLALDGGPDWPAEPPVTEGAARKAIRARLASVLRTVLSPRLDREARFLLRQIVLGGHGAEMLFAEVLVHRVEALARFIAVAECIEDGDYARRRALTIILQTILLPTVRDVVQLNTGWSDITDHVPDLVDTIYPLQPGDPRS